MTALRESHENRIPVKRVIHTIHAVRDLAACRAHYLDTLGGLIFAEGYFDAEDRDMALLYVADFMVEPMAPRHPDKQDKPFARYVQRYGEGFHSFEIQVDDGPAVSAKLRDAGCKLASDYGFFFFIRQESTGGMLLEVCDLRMPNDPFYRRNWRSDLSEGHPTTLLRLDHIACVTADVGGVIGFFTGLLNGEVLSDTHVVQPQPTRRVLIQLAETRIAFLQPDEKESGPLGARLQTPSSGIYAMVWQVENETTAQTFFNGKNLRTTREHCVSPGFAIHPQDFQNARHEFFAVSV